MADNPSDKPTAGKMRVIVPAELEPTYANLALITNALSEIVIDFAQVMPRAGNAKIKSRTVMTPMNAKLLLRALGEHLARYEQRYGEITIPKGHSLADQLFRSAQDDPDDPDSEDDS